MGLIDCMVVFKLFSPENSFEKSWLSEFDFDLDLLFRVAILGCSRSGEGDFRGSSELLDLSSTLRDKISSSSSSLAAEGRKALGYVAGSTKFTRSSSLQTTTFEEVC